MKNKKINKNMIYISLLIILIFVFGLTWLMSKSKPLTGNPEEIVIRNDDGTLTVNRNGQVTFINESGTFVDQWDTDKTNTFFNYIYNKYANSSEAAEENFPDSVTFTLNGTQTSVALNSDELVDVVVNDTVNNNTGTDNGSGDNGGEDIGDYFTTPTPNATSTPSSGFLPTPTPYAPDPHPDCLYWKLSYCAVPRTPTPAPTAAPGDNAVIEAADCTDWNSQSSNNTIINNTICIPD